MSSTLEQIREFTTLGETSIFAVEMMDRGVYKTVRRFSGPIRLPFPKARWIRALIDIACWKARTCPGSKGRFPKHASPDPRLKRALLYRWLNSSWLVLNGDRGVMIWRLPPLRPLAGLHILDSVQLFWLRTSPCLPSPPVLRECSSIHRSPLQHRR